MNFANELFDHPNFRKIGCAKSSGLQFKQEYSEHPFFIFTI